MIIFLKGYWRIIFALALIVSLYLLDFKAISLGMLATFAVIISIDYLLGKKEDTPNQREK